MDGGMEEGRERPKRTSTHTIYVVMAAQHDGLTETKKR